MTSSTSSGLDSEGKGTLHVQVLRASNLPNMDFGRQQDPYVVVRFEDDTISDNYSRTDTIKHGGQHPEWTENDNRDLEVYWNNLSKSKVFLLVEVYNDSFGNDDLIGTGKYDVTKIVRDKLAAATEFTVHLHEHVDGRENRGEVVLKTHFGPPVRKAIRAVQRLGKILDARDSLVGSICTTKEQLCGRICKATERPREYIFTNKYTSAAVAACGAATALSVGTICTLITVPLIICAVVTFPLWIIPALFGSVATAPLWVPILFLLLLLLGCLLFCLASIGLTSRPVRKEGMKLGNRFKKSDVGQRIVYENNTKSE